MEKELIFFDSVGLTNTSANHICNLAKEYIQNISKSLDNIKFYKTKVSLIGNSAEQLLSDGVSDSEINEIPKMLGCIAEAKSLIAWLREAIKARESLIKKVTYMSIEEYCKINNIEIPQEPSERHALTEDEYYGSLSVKDRNRYYQLETESAIIGKYIHPDGIYAKARNEMKDKIHNPHYISGSGRDSIIYTYEITASVENVDDIFFKLQKKHREVQAELNHYKFECEKAVNQSTTDAYAEYNKEYETFKVNFQKLNNEFTEWKHNKTVELGNLKIIIPNSLTRIFNIIQDLGKELEHCN